MAVVKTENENVPQVVDEKPRPAIPILAGNRGLELRSLDEFWRFANFVVKSGLAPKGMESPEACIIAMQIGAEIGLSPMQAIQNIAVINNRPSVWGDAVKGLVLSTGACEDFREWFENESDPDKIVAWCTIKRRGYSEVKRSFSMADAKRAGLLDKTGSLYKTYPKRMLQMRARSWACRDAFPDALKGLFVAEEARDMPAETIDVTPARAPREVVSIDPAQITNGAPPENPKASVDDSPQPVAKDRDERGAMIAGVTQLLADIPADELRQEIISGARKEAKMKNNDWQKWDTDAIEILRNALTKE